MKIKITRDTFHDGEFVSKGAILNGKPSDFIILLALGKAVEVVDNLEPEPESEPEPAAKPKNKNK